MAHPRRARMARSYVLVRAIFTSTMTSANETELRAAATLVLLRDAADGPEVLLLRRKSELAFYGGAWVFPGGAIDAEDRVEQADDTLAARNAAVRELREEAGLALPGDALLHFAQWVTPPGRTRRFDTWFFAAHAALAADQAVQIDPGEMDAFRWMTPRAALEARMRRELELPPPTFVTLTVLAAHAAATDALAALRASAVRYYAPHPCVVAPAGLVYLYEGDAGYATRDPEAPGARHRLVVRGERGEHWSYELA